MTTHKGIPASPGISTGPAFVLDSDVPPIPELVDPAASFTAASAATNERLKAASQAAADRGLDEAAEILNAQSLMASDPTLYDTVKAKLADGDDLETALEAATSEVTTALEASGSEYLAARAADVREIADLIRFTLAGIEPQSLASISRPSVVFAAELTAAETSQLDPATVVGFVTEHGGPTGHVAVIARSLGIPAVVGYPESTSVKNGATVWIDGTFGIVIVDPTDAETLEMAARQTAAAGLAEIAAQYRDRRVSFDGTPITVAANVGGQDDVLAAVEARADGIGLYRTEFLFLDTATPPTEDTQRQRYEAAAGAFTDAVVVRTFDIGGDKPAAYLDMAAEENPFLGVRGMRVYRDYRDLAVSQARALLVAANAGDLWVMAPMVATPADAIAIRGIFDEARESLAKDSIESGEIKLGAMIEIPAAAVIADTIAPYVDFYSIGTNDLTQYTFAADRTSSTLAEYNDPADPALLRLCAMSAKAASAAGIPISVCGEAAADPHLGPLFLAMGVTKLSVSVPAVHATKHRVDSTNPSAARDALAQALQADSAASVRRICTELLP